MTEITLCLVFQDLSRLGRDLAQVVIIDNSPASYIFHPDNAVSSVSIKCFTLLYRITVCCYNKYARKDLAMYQYRLLLMACTCTNPITQRRIHWTCITCQKQEINRMDPYFCDLIYIFLGGTWKDAIFNYQFMIVDGVQWKESCSFVSAINSNTRYTCV